jgi:hypothetical protein
MKKHAYTMIAMIVLFGCMAVSVRAQCSSVTSKANIPFPFNVAQTSLPAFEYTVTCLEPEAGLLLLKERPTDAGSRDSLDQLC